MALGAEKPNWRFRPRSGLDEQCAADYASECRCCILRQAGKHGICAAVGPLLALVSQVLRNFQEYWIALY